MTEPAFRYVVVRAHPDLPDGFLPPEQEGRWYDLDAVPLALMPQTDGGLL